ncbi:MAG: DUF427 domain-containing protein [Egibacteraceae bacterium]
MALTVGSGPFGEYAQGEFNFTREGPAHVLLWEDSPRRVRVMFGGEIVADTRQAKLLHETGILPVYYLPEEDVRKDLLEPSNHRTHCPFKGEASYWSVRAGGRVAQDAVWAYPKPLEHTPPISGYQAFYWDRMDHWFEEDEEVFVHARDPYHRVDVLDSSRHVLVLRDGEVLADSLRPRILFESGLPPRYYLPASDVRTDLLTPTPTLTRCPYKGLASYWSVRIGETVVPDLVWSYADPLPEVGKIAGRFCFFNEKVELEVDGQQQICGPTPFS